MDTPDTLDTAKYARIVGVFRDRAKADQAVEALKQAGMSDVELMVYDPQAAGVVETSVDTSAVETATRLATATCFLVHVLAEGRSVTHCAAHGSRKHSKENLLEYTTHPSRR